MATSRTVLDASATTSGMRPVPAPALAVGAGLATGALTSFAQTVLPDPLGGLANAVSPWLVVPFVVGAVTRRWTWALVAGTVACLGQVAGYYVTATLRGFPVGTTWVVFWLLCGLVGGLVAGAAGWSWRRAGRGGATAWSGRERGAGGALLVAVWLAEALVTYALVLRYADDALVFATAGVVAFALLGRYGRQHGAIVRWLGPVALVVGTGFGALHAL